MTDSAILIVEDDRTLRDLLKYNLQKEGYKVWTAADGEEGLEVFHNKNIDLILLDMMLPVVSGLEVCRIVRSEKPVPIIMLTAKAEEIDKVVGLEMGADDYVTKPFSMRELQARIKALLRRSQEQISPASADAKSRYLESGAIKIDLERHEVFHKGNPVELNPKEFELLVFLISNRGKVLSREQILRKVWGYDYIGNARTVDVHVRWLRRKLEKDAEHPRYLLTVRGYGYKFAV
ncbi:MAG: response regulator transcription factor [Dehalococcoidia bacterium]|jgi:two-component system OmpR family response regulator